MKILTHVNKLSIIDTSVARGCAMIKAIADIYMPNLRYQIPVSRSSRSLFCEAVLFTYRDEAPPG